MVNKQDLIRKITFLTYLSVAIFTFILSAGSILMLVIYNVQSVIPIWFLITIFVISTPIFIYIVHLCRTMKNTIEKRIWKAISFLLACVPYICLVFLTNLRNSVLIQSFLGIYLVSLLLLLIFTSILRK